MAIHCYGKVEILDEQDTADALKHLITQFEPSLHENTALMPLNYQQKLATAIVGLKITVDDIQAKEELGQIASQSNQAGVYQALRNSQTPNDRILADYMQQRKLGTGED